MFTTIFEEDRDHPDLGDHPVSSLSRLYHLEPLGVGTEQVESLTSYITRLAKAYCVTTDILVSKVILPCLGKEEIISSAERSQWIYSFMDRGSCINGFSPLAAQCVQSLEILTSTMNLRYLTMLPWQEVISNQGMIRLRVAWCPRCYKEQRQASQPIYDQLLWVLSDVYSCPRHEQWLVIACPNCQKAIPALNRVASPGYCPFCHQWLGILPVGKRTQLIGGTRESLHKELWRTQQIGALLAYAPLQPHPPSREQIAIMLRYCADRDFAGSVRKLANMMGYGISQVIVFSRRKEIPRLKALLDFCNSLNISLLDFLTSNPASKVPSPEELLDQLLPISRAPRDILTEREKTHLRKQLDSLLIIRGIALPSLEKIAARLGVGVKALRKYCPDQYQALTGSSKRWDSDEMKLYVRQTLQGALDGEEIFSLNGIQELLGCARSILYRSAPDLCDAISARYQEQFPRALIELHLQEALTHTRPVPTLNALVQQKGWNPAYVRYSFPELCREISSQHKAWQRETRQKRREEQYQMIREAIKTLHQKGIYPSKSEVCKLIGKPFFMMEADRRSAWQTEIEALGYKERMITT